MQKLEILALAISVQNGAFTPDTKAFKLQNVGLLKTYRPEKKVDSENYRVFSTIMGSFKALISDLQVKCSGKNHRLSSENTLKDLLSLFEGYKTEPSMRPIVLFLRRAFGDDSISINTPLSWFQETTIEEN